MMKCLGCVLCIVAVALSVLLALSWIRHQICLSREEELLMPLGSMVDVEGHSMSVYTEGEGSHTLVFLSGGGTCSPILDFKSLYSLLSDDYRIVVVEKFGYGFSDVVDGRRDVDTMLRQTRTALRRMNIEGPYVLCPHSMSGIEALYWAQQYPEEVAGIIGLDMVVPAYYDVMKVSVPVVKLGQYAAALGVTRWLPGIAESDAIRGGTLTDREKEIYRAIFYRRTLTRTMISEVQAICDSAAAVARGGVPEVPVLLFISDGTGGMGVDAAVWQHLPRTYFAGAAQAEFIDLDCPHYVHNYRYREIAAAIRAFLP
ncbi:MAG: alpha/beta hydrolase [Clostridia bacterium]|nr:alpha/beta hydrolase [Clostridia bacterium]